jgi:hypothetical protein
MTVRIPAARAACTASIASLRGGSAIATNPSMRRFASSVPEPTATPSTRSPRAAISAFASAAPPVPEAQSGNNISGAPLT